MKDSSVLGKRLRTKWHSPFASIGQIRNSLWIGDLQSFQVKLCLSNTQYDKLHEEETLSTQSQTRNYVKWLLKLNAYKNYNSHSPFEIILRETWAQSKSKVQAIPVNNLTQYSKISSLSLNMKKIAITKKNLYEHFFNKNYLMGSSCFADSQWDSKDSIGS